MKGLSPYTMAAMPAEEVASEHTYSTAMSLAMAIMLTKVRKLTLKKASASKSVQTPMFILHTFTNVLKKSFVPRGYLYKGLIADIIKLLANMSQLANILMVPLQSCGPCLNRVDVTRWDSWQIMKAWSQNGSS